MKPFKSQHKLSLILSQYLATLNTESLTTPTAYKRRVDRSEWSKLYQQEFIIRRLGLLNVLINQLNQYEEGRIFLDTLEKSAGSDPSNIEKSVEQVIKQVIFNAPSLREQAQEARFNFELIALLSAVSLAVILPISIAMPVFLLPVFFMMSGSLIAGGEYISDLKKRGNILSPLNAFMDSMGYKPNGASAGGGYRGHECFRQHTLWQTPSNRPVKMAERGVAIDPAQDPKIDPTLIGLSFSN